MELREETEREAAYGKLYKRDEKIIVCVDGKPRREFKTVSRNSMASRILVAFSQ